MATPPALPVSRVGGTVEAVSARLRPRVIALFPQAPASPWPPWLAGLGYAITAVAITWCELARQSGLAATSSFWAEDGHVLYHDVLTQGFFKNITTPYNGYLQLVPRLAMELARLFPVRDASRLAATGGALALALCALFVFAASRGHIGSVFSRSVLVGSIVLLPLATAELLDNLINLSWWLLVSSFWVLLWRPARAWQRVAAALFCFAAAASTPLVVFFLPLALLRAIALPEPEENWATLGLLAGLALQVLIVVAFPGVNTPSSPRTWGAIPALFLLRVAAGSLGGVTLTNSMIVGARTFGMLVGAAVIVGVVALALATRSRRVYLFAGVGLALCVVMFVFEMWDRGIGPFLDDLPVNYGSRYVQTPLLLLLMVAIVSADGLGARVFNRGPRLGILLVALALIPAWIADFDIANDRSAGPDWPREVAQAARACATSTSSTQRLAISPAGWSVVVPCSALR
jgi:hypothetical protein